VKKIVFLLVFISGFLYALDPALINHWKETMKYGIASQRAAVIKSIEDSKAPEVYNITEEAMVNDINPDVRGSAVFSLITLKIKDEKLWLGALNTETNTDVLRKIVFAISELGIKSAGKRLLSLLTNNIDDTHQIDLSSGLLRAIGGLSYREALPEVLGILTNIGYDTELRSSAAIAIGDIGKESEITILSNILENTGENKEIRMFSAFSIGKTGSLKAIGILTPVIENEKEDLNIRLYSISGLSYVKDKSVFNKLVEFTESENPRIRLEAIRSIARSPDVRDAEELLRFKSSYDPDPDIQKEAKNTLKSMGAGADAVSDRAKKSSSSAPASGTPKK
jgi:HEAT repeat protein